MTESAAMTPGNPVWYHGVLSKSKADTKLRDAGVEQGAFLVRDRPGHAGEYVLGIMFKGRETHHLVRRSPDTGTYLINNKDFGPYRSISEIVDSFSSDGLPSEWPVKLTMPIPFEGARDRTQSDAASPDQVNISLPGAPDDMSNDRHGTMGTTAQDERAREAAQAARQAEQEAQFKLQQAEAAARQAADAERQLQELQRAKEEAEIRHQQEMAIARHQLEQQEQEKAQLAALATPEPAPEPEVQPNQYASPQPATHTMALPGMPMHSVTDSSPNAYKMSPPAASPYQQPNPQLTPQNAYQPQPQSSNGYGASSYAPAHANGGAATAEAKESYIRRIHDSRLDATRSEFDHGDFFRVVVLRPSNSSFGIGIGQQLEITGWVKAVNFVDPRGPADSFLQVDDEFVSINGKPTAELELQQVKEILRSLGNALDVVVFRRRPKLEGHKPSAYSHKKKLDDRCSNTVWCACAACREREEQKKKERAKMMGKVRGSNSRRRGKDDVVTLNQGYGTGKNDAYIV